MSIAAERARKPELPPEWARLERAVEDAALAAGFWRRRASEAEEEVVRLRRTLEDLAGERRRPADLDEELRQLRAQNAALQSRMLQAHKRIGTLLKHLATLRSAS